ncbi:ABC transporter permease [Alcanivorax sp.]|uniref:ABC transporter permease n=1 Tax=Alcanivorax sp. TaxID=1872427 RepID=UPI000C65EDAB|nr:ABC transporter permease [Alcanivorax sp.]MBQ23715.1 urea ABC transporter permease [Alcanivorax sp.]
MTVIADIEKTAESTPLPGVQRKEKRRRKPWLDYGQSLNWKNRWLIGACGWLIFISGWYLAANMDLAPARLFPGPDVVMASLWDLFAEQGFAGDVLSSIRRIAVSFSLAVMMALPLGMLMGSFARVDALLNPLLGAFRYLPAPAFIPLLLMWLGTGDAQKITLLMIGVVFFLVIMLADVTRQVPSDFIETAKTLGGNRKKIMWTVVLRQSLPGYVDTCRQMLAVSWTYLVIAEIVAASDGIGAMMMRAKRFVHVDDIMAGIVTIGCLGLLFDAAFRLFYRVCFPYLKKNANEN